MGVQVYFSKEDAVKAGAEFRFYYCKDADQFFETYRIPEVKDRCFINYCCSDESFSDLKLDKVCTDFNDWGSNKEFLLPWLEKNNINFYVA